MSFWKRTMDYLGLGPDDAYDDYDDYDDYEQPVRQRRPEVDPRPVRPIRDDTSSEGVVRTMPSRPTFPSRDFDPSPTRRAAEREEMAVQPRPQRPSPSPVQSHAPSRSSAPPEPATVRPRRFDQAQEVADKFKEGQPVIMNLESADREISRRLIDFASGLCYGLDGTMEKVASGVYLLKPIIGRSAQGDYDDYEEFDYDD